MLTNFPQAVYAVPSALLSYLDIRQFHVRRTHLSSLQLANKRWKEELESEHGKEKKRK
jgi:hypothetical protein